MRQAVMPSAFFSAAATSASMARRSARPRFSLAMASIRVRLRGIVRAVGIGVAALVQHGLDDPAGGLIVQLLADGIGRHQLGHVQHGVRVTGEHAGAGRTVHAALAALGTFAVVMAVDHGAVQRAAHKVKLVAELGHLVGAVLVAGDYLINGVQHHGHVALFLGPADELGGQLVHGHGTHRAGSRCQCFSGAPAAGPWRCTHP